MTNRQIYAKTFGFSLRRVLFSVLSAVIFLALLAGGFLIGHKIAGVEAGLLGLVIGLVIGLVVVSLISRFISYALKAGQIAMITRGVTEDSLPDDVIAEGKKTVKERFLTVAVFFAITGAIKGIFQQLSRLLTRAGDAIGGDTGRGIANAISTAVQILVGYLCDCCLGWVFFRKAQSAAKAACEGAVIFFKHGKTLLKNIGRIFGLGLLSLLLIGGLLSAAFSLILFQFPAVFQNLAAIFAEAAAEDSEIPAFLTNPTTLTIAAGILLGFILWNILHGVFVRPFVLTGVLRNFMEAGRNDIPDEASFALLDGKSKKFAKLHAEVG